MLRPFNRMDTEKGMLNTATSRSLTTRLAMKRWEEICRALSRQSVLRKMQLGVEYGVKSLLAAMKFSQHDEVLQELASSCDIFLLQTNQYCYEKEACCLIVTFHFTVCNVQVCIQYRCYDYSIGLTLSKLLVSVYFGRLSFYIKRASVGFRSKRSTAFTSKIEVLSHRHIGKQILKQLCNLAPSSSSLQSLYNCQLMVRALQFQCGHRILSANSITLRNQETILGQSYLRAKQLPVNHMKIQRISALNLAIEIFPE